MHSSASGSSPRATGASGRALGAALAAALLGGAPCAHAFWNDRLEVYFAENVTYDSNVFRLPGGDADGGDCDGDGAVMGSHNDVSCG